MNLSDYYMDAPLHEPPHIEQREFGVIKKGGGMWRHLSFENVDKLRSFLIRHQPLHVYFSASKYEHPEHRPMIDGKPTGLDKGWLCSDLIFDIDNDHLTTPTMAEATYQANKLYWFLKNKFGLKDMFMVFSGSRGYHVHVRDECVQDLDSYERREIADCFQEFMLHRDKYGRRIYNKQYVCIDAPVTITPSHLIRLPGTIHGGTMQPCRILAIE